jgi:hypothetical protein
VSNLLLASELEQSVIVAGNPKNGSKINLEELLSEGTGLSARIREPGPSAVHFFLAFVGRNDFRTTQRQFPDVRERIGRRGNPPLLQVTPTTNIVGSGTQGALFADIGANARRRPLTISSGLIITWRKCGFPREVG